MNMSCGLTVVPATTYCCFAFSCWRASERSMAAFLRAALAAANLRGHFSCRSCSFSEWSNSLPNHKCHRASSPLMHKIKQSKRERTEFFAGEQPSCTPTSIIAHIYCNSRGHAYSNTPSARHNAICSIAHTPPHMYNIRPTATITRACMYSRPTAFGSRPLCFQAQDVFDALVPIFPRAKFLP